ncbi:MAG: hypothetical protein JO244_09125, partial [Solirubrobacterales bacterium]|nr:hypothetical protein [Solirubrobacterales bacterium]
DSLNGLFHALPEDGLLLVQLQELLTYLDRHGVVSLMVVTQHGLRDHDLKPPMDINYLTDTVILLRCYEAGSQVRHAISVIKKRTGPHDRAIHAFEVGPKGLHVGPPLPEIPGSGPAEPSVAGGGGNGPSGT